jgi:flagellar biosynthesis protein FlhG
MDIFKKLDKVTKKFLGLKLKNIGFLPEDKSLPKAVIEQKPVSILFPRSNITRAFEKLSQNVLNNTLYVKDTKNGLTNIFTSILRRKDRG